MKEMMCELCDKFTRDYQKKETTTDLAAKQQMIICGIEILCQECCEWAGREAEKETTSN